MNHIFPRTAQEILVIDDEKDLLEIIQQALSDAGYVVRVATTGNDGLKLYEKRSAKIGLVLLDYLLPDLTGDLVLEHMQVVNPYVAVILMTGAGDEVRRKSFAQGLRGCLMKPFYMADLLERVREELGYPDQPK
jgi:DNA-binding response OmpR family regulator